jgi:hypothetical protein
MGPLRGTNHAVGPSIMQWANHQVKCRRTSIGGDFAVVEARVVCREIETIELVDAAIIAIFPPTGSTSRYRPSVGMVNSGPRRVPAVQRWVMALYRV